MSRKTSLKNQEKVRRRQLDDGSADFSQVGVAKTARARRRNIPVYMRLTPEKEAENERMQMDLQAEQQSPYAATTPQEQMRARAARVIEDWKEMRKRLHAEIIKGGEPLRLAELDALYQNASIQLADNLALVGRYDEAHAYDPRPEERARWRMISKAINRDDDEDCGCVKFLGQLTQKFRLFDVWSTKHNRVMPLVGCNCQGCDVCGMGSPCGFMNVQSLPQDLQRMSELRARAVEMTRGASSVAESEEIMRSRNHTAIDLLFDGSG